MMPPGKANPPSDPVKRAFRRKLLGWYDRHARDLPWRETRDPYRVWLSEIMLQQTRVAAVVEHYQEFLRRFPTVEKLATARESSVLAAWSGLGYYRRARMLHAAAKVIVREHGGKFPLTTEGLRELPGVGRYTSAAIASIAFDEPIAVVDGNVERVLQRMLGKPLVGEELWDAANQLLDAQRPGDFNQAMMELGAIVCTPRTPACLTCPVVGLCATRGELPGSAKKARQKKREIHYALICRDSEVYLVQRARNASLMAGMWEFPEIALPTMVPAGTKAHPQMGASIAALKRYATEKQIPHRLKPVRNDKVLGHEQIGHEQNGNGQLLFTVRHSITVTDYMVRVWRMATPDGMQGKWIPVERLEHVALTGLTRKILRKAGMI
jgi:A/G-specific adenine glycosylase